MTIGQRIKERREAKKMTLDELSRFAGVTRQTLSRYETGVICAIPSDKIELIADALSTTPSYLMGWGASKPAAERDGLSEPKRELFAILKAANDRQVQEVLDYAHYVLSKR